MELLVSVRNSVEASIVDQFEVEILDIKNPDHGSLGRPEVVDVCEILTTVSTSQKSISVALGELCEIRAGELQRFFEQCDPLEQITFAKIGLSKMATANNWIHRWQQAVGELPNYIRPVAVAYADMKKSLSPPIEVVFEAGRDIGCQAYLVDTWSKSAGNCFSYILPDELKVCCRLANRFGDPFVLAGSISSRDLEQVHQVGAQVVGVRGAVCHSGLRRDHLSATRMRTFINEVNRFHVLNNKEFGKP